VIDFMYSRMGASWGLWTLWRCDETSVFLLAGQEGQDYLAAMAAAANFAWVNRSR
jgi:RNA-splicing ligase RtcB